MTYGDFKNLTRRIASDKILCDKAFDIVKNPKYDGYQSSFALMVHKLFYKKDSAMRARSEFLARQTTLAGSVIKNENISNKELSEELYQAIIRKFNKRKVSLSFIRNNTFHKNLKESSRKTNQNMVRKRQ